MKLWVKGVRFLVLVVVCLLSISTANAAIITVCSSGCDYTSIQSAVDKAYKGDTINVGPGVYNENIIIGKHINLIGAGAENTIINPTINKDVIRVRACPTTIKGFTIQGAIPYWSGLHVQSSYNCNITENVFKNAKSLGIYKSDNVSITRNNISGFFFLYESNNNAIINNVISEGEMLLDDSFSNYISENNISSRPTYKDHRNSTFARPGIYCRGITRENVVLENQIHGGYAGIEGCEFIVNNTVWDNEAYAIKGSSIVEGNTISLSDIGVEIQTLSKSSISGNVIQDCREGIFINQSSNVSIINNNVYSNDVGIELRNSKESIISRNSANNNNIDIYLMESLYNSVQSNSLDKGVEAITGGVKVKVNMELEYSDDELKGAKSGRPIRVLPSKLKILVEGEVEEIEIIDEEVPKYLVKSKEKAKLLGFVPVTMNIESQISAEDGSLIVEEKPWWGFLAR